MTHIGDIFIETVQKTADAAVQCSKGVFFTYDIQMLRYKKNKAAKEVGERVSVLVKEGAFDMSQDVMLSELVAKLDSIEKELEAHECARSKLMNQFKASNSRCECMPNTKGEE